MMSAFAGVAQCSEATPPFELLMEVGRWRDPERPAHLGQPIRCPGPEKVCRLPVLVRSKGNLSRRPWRGNGSSGISAWLSLMVLDVTGEPVDNLFDREARRVDDSGVRSGLHRGDRSGAVAGISLALVVQDRLETDAFAPCRVLGHSPARPFLVARRQIVFAKRIREYERSLVAAFRDDVELAGKCALPDHESAAHTRAVGDMMGCTGDVNRSNGLGDIFLVGSPGTELEFAL